MTEITLTIFVAVAALVVLRQFCKFKAALDRAKVQTRDPEFINKDQQPHSTPVIWIAKDGLTRGPKGFEAMGERRRQLTRATKLGDRKVTH